MVSARIERLPLLTAEECRQIRAAVYELRPHWRQRTPPMPFYTLGAASYLDAKSGENEYIALAREYNPLLQEHFGWVHERLMKGLVARLGLPAAYRQNGSLPGFHIFLADKEFRTMPAGIHVDNQYQLLDWKRCYFRCRQPISFTVAISLPARGSGLNVWNSSASELAALSTEEVTSQLLEPGRSYYYPHQIGHVTLHFGHTIHQIAIPEHVEDSDERITLQGHGICCDGTFQIYW